MAEHTSHKRLVSGLLLAAVAMFGFGFALVPLYDVFCKITGLNGKVELKPTAVSGQVDHSREVKLQLVASNNETMPWRFRAQTAMVRLAPGEVYQTAYLARNLTERDMVAQAIPSVSPAEAAPFLQKINCFCFERQPLQGFEEKQMPLLLTIAPELPAHIHTITLSYTLFDITPETVSLSERGGSAL